jgi:hypothetical protein
MNKLCWDYSKCTRCYVRNKYDSYKAGQIWAKAGYFFNRDDFNALNSTCPSIVRALCHQSYDIRLLRVEYGTIRQTEAELALSLHRWAKHNHIRSNHGFAFKLHGVKVSAAKDFIKKTA